MGTASFVPSMWTPPVSPRERVGSVDKTRARLLSHKMQPGGMPYPGRRVILITCMCLGDDSADMQMGTACQLATSPSSSGMESRTEWWEGMGTRVQD